MMDKLELISFEYNKAPQQYKKQLKDLIQLVWPTEDDEVHLNEFNVMSFCACLDEQVVGYAGVIRWSIYQEGDVYQMCGLSCVCTHPQYQGQGIGSMLIKAATDWIMKKSIADIGLFTCSPEHTKFYEHAGVWKNDNSLVLKESIRKNAYISNQLGVDVLKVLISDRAKQHASDFMNTTIILNFPEKEFI